MRCLVASFDDEKLEHDDWSKELKTLTPVHTGVAHVRTGSNTVLG
jgi:hypothetical protein